MPAVGGAIGAEQPEDPRGGRDRPGLVPAATGPTGTPRRSPRPLDAELAELATRARAGDAAAGNRVLALIHPQVVAYCRSRLGGGRIGLAGPEDVAQEVLLAVHNGLPRFESAKSPFMAFVFGIAANKVADAFRAAGRDKSVSTDELPERLDERGGPEDHALRRDDARRISELLDRLPGTGREVLVLRLGLGYSAEETARLLAMTPGAVRVAQHRALSRLRHWIASHPHDG